MVIGEWSKPGKWDREAAQTGGQQRVFCASMCDLFERYDGPVVNQQGERLYFQCDSDQEIQFVKAGIRESPVPVTLDRLRRRVFALIESTPNLIWLLLTKRPVNVMNMVPISWTSARLGGWPENIMVGYSAGTQEDLEGRHKNAEGGIVDLLAIPGKRFLSIEPLTGPVDLDPVGCDICQSDEGVIGPEQEVGPPSWCVDCDHEAGSYRNWLEPDGIHWVIVGGESGANARPMHPDWARSIRDQCVAAGVPFFFKQWGEHQDFANDCPDEDIDDDSDAADALYECAVNPVFVSMDGRVIRGRELPQDGGSYRLMERVGKKKAGRLLDGRTWDEFPVAAEVASCK